MSRLSAGRRTTLVLARAVLPAGLLLALIWSSASVAATPTPARHAAGLVIQHGDGSVLYFYVQFSEPAVAATDLLQQAGISTDVAPFAGLGQAVCRIDGEGCPASNCFCKSYANPSIYWRYQRLTSGGAWVPLPYAASQKSIHDGDVVGFAWSSQDGDLPAVTLDQIARMNGVTRDATPEPATPLQQETATVTIQTATATAVASSVAVGVKIQASGTTTPVEAPTAGQDGNSSSYALFGAGLLLISLLGAVVVIRRRRGDL